MYDVVIDVDGVLLDIHARLKQVFAKDGIDYDEKNILTYSFNTDLPDFDEYRRLPPTEEIFRHLRDPDVFIHAPVDWDSIMLIRQYAEQGMKFLIYTLSSNISVHLAKQALFTQWFGYTPNVEFRDLMMAAGQHKMGVATFTVVEDCHINLREYGSETYKFLVNKPYNQVAYNHGYFDVFNDDRFERCFNTFTAIKNAVAHAQYIKVKMY